MYAHAQHLYQNRQKKKKKEYQRYIDIECLVYVPDGVFGNFDVKARRAEEWSKTEDGKGGEK